MLWQLAAVAGFQHMFRCHVQALSRQGMSKRVISRMLLDMKHSCLLMMNLYYKWAAFFILNG